MLLIDVARNREPDPGGGATELRVGGGERRDPDHLTLDVDERPARVARVDRGTRLDGALEDDVAALGLLPVERR